LLHTLNDGSQIAVFPIWREASVQYYDIGYVRRLVMKLDAEGEIISGKMLEMVGNKEYLHTYKDDLPPSFYNGTLQSTGVIAWESELDTQGFNSQKSASGPNYSCDTNFEVSGCDLTVTEVCTNSTGTVVSTTILIAVHFEGDCSGSGLPTGGGGTTPPPGGGYNPPPDGGSNPPTGGGGGGTSSPSNPTNNPPSEPNPNTPQEPIAIFTDLDGNPVAPDRGDNTIDVPIDQIQSINIDPSFSQNTKIMGVYNQLGGVETFTELLNDFDSSIMGLDLTLKVELFNAGSGSAETKADPNQPNKITIKIQPNIIEGATLNELARTIVHEVIHAYLLAKIHQIGGLDNLNEQTYPTLFNYYVEKKFYPNAAQHEFMANYLVNLIGDVLQAFDIQQTNPYITIHHYRALAWDGLTSTTAWVNMPYVDQQWIIHLITELKQNSSYDF
jgi:hypothetical protein